MEESDEVNGMSMTDGEYRRRPWRGADGAVTPVAESAPCPTDTAFASPAGSGIAPDVPAPSPRRRRDLVLQITALAFGLSRRRLAGAGREAPRAVFARQVAMYLLHVVFSLPMQHVGELCRRDRSTVAHACRLVEERREDARFDAFLHDLERAARALDAAVMLGTNHELSIS